MLGLGYYDVGILAGFLVSTRPVSTSELTPYLGGYERNVGNGQDTSETNTKYYRALGRLVAFRRNGSLYWVGTDHLGGTVAVASSSFGPIAAMRYSPYGVSRDNVDDPLTDSLFTSQKLDTSVGLYWYGSRAYDQSLGRFVCPDSVVPSPGNPQSLNRFSYAANNPMRYTDPSGHVNYDGMGIVVYDNPSYLSEADRQALYEHNSKPSISNGSQGTVYAHESGGGGGSGGGGDPWHDQGVVDLQRFGVEPSYLPVEARQALATHNAAADLLNSIIANVTAPRPTPGATPGDGESTRVMYDLSFQPIDNLAEAQRQYDMGITRETSGWVSLADTLPGPGDLDYVTYSVSVSAPVPFVSFTAQLTKGHDGQVYLGYGPGVGLSPLPVNATTEHGVLLGGTHDAKAVDALITDVCVNGNVVPVFGRGANWSPGSGEGSYELVVGTPQVGANLTWAARLR